MHSKRNSLSNRCDRFDEPIRIPFVSTTQADIAAKLNWVTLPFNYYWYSLISFTCSATTAQMSIYKFTQLAATSNSLFQYTQLHDSCNNSDSLSHPSSQYSQFTSQNIQMQAHYFMPNFLRRHHTIVTTTEY
ncbi:hypothetical protein FRX31_030096 [Thalictrum thalictroides]|uniref:Uncharacterized protein n=1 Tax=Thalictrum thalictroides TaxID=46969 RepID=A0A7J6V818_THATH|nr:hypothetical protein FRX31_030096 [Thalictrum thalictroides]